MLKINILLSAMLGTTLIFSLIEFSDAFATVESETYKYLLQVLFGSVGAYAGIGIFFVFIKNHIPHEYKEVANRTPKE